VTAVAVPRPRVSGRRPLWAILAVLAVFGVVVTLVSFPAVRVFPGPAVLALLLLVVSGAIGWWLLRRIRPMAAPDR
jgi:protease PrsW